MKNTAIKRNRIGQKNLRKQTPVASSGNTLTLDKPSNESETIKKVKIKTGKILAITIAICTVLVTTSCNSTAKKVENAKDDVTQANEDLKKAQEEYSAEVEQFRMETYQKITVNEKEIATIKSKNKKNTEYEKQVALLEQKNTDLKRKINDYKIDTKENWLSFKTEFNKDMDELGLALKNFSVDNK